MNIGTKFVGKVNGCLCQVVDVKIDDLNGKKYAVIKDLKTNKVFEYCMKTLEHCELEII